MPLSKMSILLLILIVLGGAFGVFLYTQRTSVSSLTMTPTPTTPSVPETTPTPTTPSVPTASDVERATALSVNPNSDVVLTTDAREYRTSASVLVSLKNTTSRSLEIENPFYVIERYTNNAWVTMRYLTCPCGSECKEAAFHALIPGDTKTYTWSGSERWCREDTPDGEQRLTASEGIYRVKVNIAETNESHSGTAKTYYSPIFTIRG